MNNDELKALLQRVKELQEQRRQAKTVGEFFSSRELLDQEYRNAGPLLADALEKVMGEVETIRPILSNLRWHANAICAITGRGEHDITAIVVDVIKERDDLRAKCERLEGELRKVSHFIQREKLRDEWIERVSKASGHKPWIEVTFDLCAQLAARDEELRLTRLGITGLESELAARDAELAQMKDAAFHLHDGELVHTLRKQLQEVRKWRDKAQDDRNELQRHNHTLREQLREAKETYSVKHAVEYHEFETANDAMRQQRDTALAHLQSMEINRDHFCREINIIGREIVGSRIDAFQGDNCSPEAVTRETRNLIERLETQLQIATDALEKFAAGKNWQCLNGASCWHPTQELPQEIAVEALAAIAKDGKGERDGKAFAKEERQANLSD